MNKENREYKINGEVILRNLEESRTVSGYAVKFESESLDLGFIEVIKKGAITQDVINNSDIYARFNHDEDTVLARSRYGKGSLKLELREDGLYYEFEAPHTALGDELLEHIKRGEITTSSFAFSLPEDGSGERWYNDGDELKREIIKIDRLYDVSPVYEPAYLATSCSQRALDNINLKVEIINGTMNSLMNDIGDLMIK